MKKIIYLIFILAWMILIFCLSNQPADDSTKLSDGFIEKTIGNVYKLYDNNVSNERLEHIKKKYSHPVRKMAHFTIYLILGLLVFNYRKLYNTNIIFPLIICLLYAMSDEIHQLFIMGRSCEIMDVIIDTTGSLIGIISYYCIYKKILKRV